MMFPVMMVMMGMIRRRVVDGGWLGCSINLDSFTKARNSGNEDVINDLNVVQAKEWARTMRWRAVYWVPVVVVPSDVVN